MTETSAFIPAESASRPTPPPAWHGCWLVTLVGVACLPLSAFTLVAAEFGGRSNWREYVAAGLFWCVPLAALALARNTLGAGSRLFALLLATLGAGLLIVELPSFLANPGWQF